MITLKDPPNAPDLSASVPATTKRLRILVAEDNPNLLTETTVFLQNAGYVVLQASNLKDGIEAFRQHHPDVVFTDRAYPEYYGGHKSHESGYKLLETVKEESPQTKTIMCNGDIHFDPEDAKAHHHADFAFKKPVSLEGDLLPILQQLNAERVIALS